jgi:hypothetical protein
MARIARMFHDVCSTAEMGGFSQLMQLLRMAREWMIGKQAEVLAVLVVGGADIFARECGRIRPIKALTVVDF